MLKHATLPTFMVRRGSEPDLSASATSKPKLQFGFLANTYKIIAFHTEHTIGNTVVLYQLKSDISPPRPIQQVYYSVSGVKTGL